MMGYQVHQPKISYQFSLDERVPKNHILREINRVTDSSFIRDYVRPFYSHTGVPSVDPVVILQELPSSVAYTG
ncbi:transposase [Desulfofundulus luciae]|uniref:Transposase n=1 Tax=Desulfofundulus luciae TaxID=74702 RepID=A0ABU0B264_9FIRM|nr:hypothetical protein [Desulfofundulus luciae]MDQ0286800.1 transposase [Desulfofundulus luciae]